MHTMCNAHICTLTVNGVSFRDDLPPDTLLLDLLRGRLGLDSVTHGCDHGRCGACTVLLDGTSVKSCLILAVSVPDADVVTAESLSPRLDLRHVRQMLVSAGADICSACLPARILSLFAPDRGAALPTAAQIRAFIHDNPCHCGQQDHDGQATGMNCPERAGVA